ncbi:hypothetical protein BH09ACT8_BH09ACT8_11780 [soil metagenome]
MPPPGDDDTELLTVVAPQRRPPATTLMLIGGAVLGLVAVAGIIVSVITMSDESTRPVPQAPLTPISIPVHSTTTVAPAPSASEAAPPPAPPLAPLPPITATAQTITTAPAEPTGGPRVRDRLHELFPRLFPENP